MASQRKITPASHKRRHNRWHMWIICHRNAVYGWRPVDMELYWTRAAARQSLQRFFIGRDFRAVRVKVTLAT